MYELCNRLNFVLNKIGGSHCGLLIFSSLNLYTSLLKGKLADFSYLDINGTVVSSESFSAVLMFFFPVV